MDELTMFAELRPDDNLTEADLNELRAELFPTVAPHERRLDQSEEVDTQRPPEHSVLIPLTRTLHTRHRPLLFIAAAAAIAVLVGGIAAVTSLRDSSPVSDQPDRTAPPRPDDLPATGVMFSPEDALVLSVAQDTLIAECMTAKGVEYPIPTTDELIAVFGEWQPHAVLGIQRAGAARRVGYHSVGVGGFGTPSQANARQLMDPAQREAFSIALQGPELAAATTPEAVTDPDTGQVNVGGCWGQVYVATPDNDEEHRAAVNEAGNIGEMAPSGSGFDDVALDDQRVRDALDTWSTCVETLTGEQADTPNELARRFLADNYEGSANAEEVGIATTDAECQQEADLWTTWYSVVAELTRNRLGPDAGLYDDWTRARVEMVNAARATLSDRNIELPSLN